MSYLLDTNACISYLNYRNSPIAHQVTLVTHNIREFSRVDDLQFEDWLLWNVLNDITPSLWLFIILMTSTGLLWVVGYLREKLLPSSKEVTV